MRRPQEVTAWLVDSKTIAARLSVSTRTVERLTAEGGMPCVRFRGKRLIRYSPEAVRRWLEAGCPRRGVEGQRRLKVSVRSGGG